MHNLSGVFVREEKSEIINKIVYYPFSVVYPKKTRTYFCEKDNECKNWIKCIRKATGYQNLIDIYDVKVLKLLYNLGKTRKWQIWTGKIRQA